MAPKDTKELELMIDLSLDIKGPVAIRYPRGNSYFLDKGKYEPIKLGEYEVINKGKDIAVIAIGNMVKQAIDSMDILKEKGIEPTIVNARFLKPIDESILRDIFNNHKYIVTIEDNVIIGGFGSRINKFLIDNNYDNKILNIALEEEFIPHGDINSLYEAYGLSAKCIAQKIENLLN